MMMRTRTLHGCNICRSTISMPFSIALIHIHNASSKQRQPPHSMKKIVKMKLLKGRTSERKATQWPVIFKYDTSTSILSFTSVVHVSCFANVFVSSRNIITFCKKRSKNGFISTHPLLSTPPSTQRPHSGHSKLHSPNTWKLNTTSSRIVNAIINITFDNVVYL